MPRITQELIDIDKKIGIDQTGSRCLICGKAFLSSSHLTSARRHVRKHVSLGKPEERDRSRSPSPLANNLRGICGSFSQTLVVGRLAGRVSDMERRLMDRISDNDKRLAVLEVRFNDIEVALPYFLVKRSSLRDQRFLFIF